MFTSNLTNQTHTNNGALAYKSTNSAVLDLFANGVTSDNKHELLINALYEDTTLALKVALYLRDVRNGQGNRDILKELFKTLEYKNELDLMIKILKHLPEIGRWKDVIELINLNPNLDVNIFTMIRENIGTDALLAKWLPRQGNIAKKIIGALDWSHGDYRRHIAKLSKTVEQKMCIKKWDRIEYSHVPSIANKKYAKAFLRNDEDRRNKFLEKATKGEVKINSSVLYPHQISNMCLSGNAWSMGFQNNPTADALWSQLPNYMEKAVNVLPIIDLSGSMTTPAIGTDGSCISVAIGLGLYFAEHNTGSYKDLWMNFSTNPQAYMLKGTTLSERMSNLDTRNWSQSTDIDKAMEFVLHAAKQSPEDIPKMIVIVSDMEFNRCVKTQSNFEYMQSIFKEAGLTMPTVVFWRVNTKSGSNPVTQHESGAVLINGYSPSVMKSILSGDIANYTPYKAMMKIIEPMYTWLEE